MELVVDVDVEVYEILLCSSSSYSQFP